MEFEAKLKRDFFPQFPCLTIYQYKRWRFEPEIIKGVIMKHPFLVHGNSVYRNFYSIELEEYLREQRNEREV